MTIHEFGKDNKQIVSSKNVSVGDAIEIYFSDGVLKATVTEKEEGGPSF